LNGGTQNNHPEIKLHLHEVLGQIADTRNDKITAASNFQMALSQAKEQIGRLTQVDTISSQIKIDEIRSAYIQKSENYKRERLWLIFIVVVTALLLAVGSLLYWNIRRKKYYEKLLFDAKTKELAHINSHEVRRHLSNIMGIIDNINQSDDRYEEYLQTEKYLFSEAGKLDIAIKNISAKLDN
jgi:hypothetical protein